MTGNYTELVDAIVSGVGGAGNISAVTHCVTRLRFVLKQESLAQTDVIKGLDGVLTVVQAGGQFQVVVGDKVDVLYDDLVKRYEVNGEGAVEVDEKPLKGGNVVSKFMGTISGILAPLLGVLTAAGIVKGLVSLALTLGWAAPNSGEYMLLYALGDGFFYFLPVLIGFTAARKFGSSEFIGAAIGCALVYPAMVNIGTALEVAGTLFDGTPFAMSYFNTFLGIPIVMPGSGYTSSIVPAILAVWFASKVEKTLKRALPDALRGILTPLVTLVVSVVVTYLAIGPISMALCGVVIELVNALFALPVVGGAIGGAIVGGGFGLLVMFGLHWVVIAAGLSAIAVNGFDYIMACGGVGPLIGMAQGLALCFVARKNPKVRDLAVPATISQICGVGEPLMYSMFIPLKRPLVLNIAGGCLAGAIVGGLRTKLYVFGGSGLFCFPGYISPTGDTSDLVKFAIGIGIACVVVFIAQVILYRDEDAKILEG